MDGYVLFPDAAAYEIRHVRAREALGLPRVGFRAGRPAPDRQQTVSVAGFRTNRVNGDDPKVLVYIQRVFWPSDTLTDLVFLTKDAVTDYLPLDEPDI